MSGPVTLERRDAIAIITIDNPPVNACSQAVRAGLVAAAETIATDPAIRGVVLLCAGRTFVAGADITEFGKPPQHPTLSEAFDVIEALDKPVLALLHGTALGGGLELALACHWRLIDPAGTVGLPEVTLGIIPGAGGTQRLPRLIGLTAALDLIPSGRRVAADEALRLGIVDAVTSGDRVAFALAFLRDRLAAPLRRASTLPFPPADPSALKTARATTAKRSPGQIAPVRAIDVLDASTALDFAAGLRLEAITFAELRVSAQSKALRHIFFAERAIAKVPEVQTAAPRPVHRVGVIGGGTMGAGIAAAVLLAGLPVTLVERDPAALAAGRDRVAAILGDSVKRGKLTPEERDRILGERLDAAADMATLNGVDLVIEAVFEDMGVKQALFRDLSRVVRGDAVLATNTSYLDVAQLADSTAQPANVIGLHFFSPAHVMKLLEVVVPEGAAPEAVATGFWLGKRLGKLAVRAGNSDGFIGNRILSAYRRAADMLVEDGASPWQVDAAFRTFGFPMGLFEMQDMAGLDIGWANRKRLAPHRDPAERYVAISDRLCEAGRFGRKTGRGYYVYEDGRAIPDPEVDSIVAAERSRKGIVPRLFTSEQIEARITVAMINEAARVLGEGVALRAGDIDVVMVNGYGFPRWRGGPLHMADARGLTEVVAELDALCAEDTRFWQPASLLRSLAASGRTFTSG